MKDGNKSSSPPGLLQFGKKKGDWKNPMSPKGKFSKSKDHGSSGGININNTNNAGDNTKIRTTANLEKEDAADASEISEIISAEAFRLSRDGIIQHHYVLNNTARTTLTPPSSPAATSPTTTSSVTFASSTHRHPVSRKLNKASAKSSKSIRGGGFRGKPNSSMMLSTYSSENPQEAARYYKECAQRPKGYRRLIVSSATPTSDVPPPPTSTTPASTYKKMSSYASSRAMASSKVGGGGAGRRTSESTWHFESSDDLGGVGEEKSKKEGRRENLFDNVEYQYIGPPQTGPEFFHLLRSHGAATFGRYLPELACNVPNHSIGFELRHTASRTRSRRRTASTQPFVVEAPHIVWGDAHDKMLSRIAREGCPLIDSRDFEYVSNAALDETELSESLMVCGATLWVENAKEDGDDARSPTKFMSHSPRYTKDVVKAKYYGGKVLDGITEGLGVGVKGLTRGTKKTAKVVVKGTREVAHEIKEGTKEVANDIKEGSKRASHGGTELSRVPQQRDLPSTDRAPSPAPSEGGRKKGRKRSKLKAMLNPKKVGDKLRRRSRGKDDDGMSINSSGYSALGDDEDDVSSDGGESAATDSAHAIADVVEESAESEDVDTHVSQAVETPKNETSNHEAPEKDGTGDFTIVRPVPYVLLVDDIINIRIVSFPDKNDVIADFPTSVATVMAQRNIEDRMSNPLKPSEYTTTLVQEPNAQELRWGVELKVTLRAVEVHPNIPRVVPRPKDVIDEEFNKFKEKLKLLGKKPEEIKKDLQAKEDEILNEENDLNKAIVAYGYGKGENQGAPQSEVRHRQMFYCDREHGTISRKMKRRQPLTFNERRLVQDAMIDPSAFKKDYDKEDKQKMLDLIDLNFPGIEKENAVNNELSSPDADSSARMSLNTVSVAAISKNDGSAANGTLAKASLAMAQSLDNCLGGLADKPTVSALQSRLCRTFTEGMASQVTRSAAKVWCSQVAEKVSSVSTSDAPIKSTIAKIQSIIAESALGPGIDFEESIHKTDEEMKLKESEIALSQAKSLNSEDESLGSSKLLEWINAVSSQLEAYAEELDGSEESLDSIEQVDEENERLSIIGESPDPVGTSTAPSSSRFGGWIAESALMAGEQFQQASSVGASGKVDPDGELPDSVSSRKESSKSLKLPSSSSSDSDGELRDNVSSRKESSKPAKPLSSSIDLDADMWDDVLSEKKSSKSGKPLSRNSLRFRNATSISSVKKALPRSQTRAKSNQTEPLWKMMNESHGHSHHVTMRPKSLSETLVQLSLVVGVCSFGAAAVYKFYQVTLDLVM